MGRLRFVQPALERLPLTEGDWIDVKRELTAGEQREAHARIMRAAALGERPTIEFAQVEIATVVAYLHAWSFADAEGRPVDVSEAAINALDTATFREVFAAITAHEAAIAAKKAGPNGGPGS